MGDVRSALFVIINGTAARLLGISFPLPKPESAMTEELLDRKATCALLKMGRSTLYERMQDPSFPKPVSRARARLKFKRSDIEAWQKAQEAQRPENREKAQCDLEKLAHSPRKGEREKRRRAGAFNQAGTHARVVDPYAATAIDDADRKRLVDRLEVNKGSKQFRRSRVYAPSLGW